MKGIKKMITLLALAVVVTACTPGAGTSPTSGVTPQTPAPQEPSQVSPTPFDAPILPPKGALEAQKLLADQLGLAVDAVTIRDIESVEWTDSCLGLGGPAESCLAAITPGYRVTLTANGQEYVYRTDTAGEAVRAESPVVNVPGVELPDAILAAIIGRLNVSPEEAVILEAEQVDWPDACLGIQKAGIACAQVIVPGYRVVVDANGQTYTFRTDLTGNQVVQEDAGISKGGGLLRFERDTDSSCGELSISGGQAWVNACGNTPRSIELSPARMKEWKILVSSFSGFEQEADGMAIQFEGTGRERANQAEERSLAAWAGLVMDEAEAGKDLPDNGIMLTWHREGGVAGFCDNLTVYTSGFAVSSTCKGQPEERGRTRISAEQLDRLYAWTETFDSFEQEQKDPAVADAMTIRTEFVGTGSQLAPADVRAELERLAAEWFASAGRAK